MTEYSNHQKELTRKLSELNNTLTLPKETEYFMSDLHGDYAHFIEVLSNAAGKIKENINLCFKNDLNATQKKELNTLLTSPEKQHALLSDKNSFQLQCLFAQLRTLVIYGAKKYPFKKVQQLFPQEYRKFLKEILSPNYSSETIYKKLVRANLLKKILSEMTQLILKLTINHLHIIGDIFDRGPKPNKIIDFLSHYHSVDIQWGNHDITWMGAARGSSICLMNIIRICARYGHLSLLEDDYHIDLTPLYEFSDDVYLSNPAFEPKIESDDILSLREKEKMNKIQQATSIIQFKLEQQLILRRPEFNLNHRQLLNHIDYMTNTLQKQTTTYQLSHTCFQTIDPLNPDELTKKETALIHYLQTKFKQAQKLQKHIDFLLDKGSMYLTYNDNLLLHGCVPLTDQHNFQPFTYQGQAFSGKDLLDFYEEHLRIACTNSNSHDDFSTDLIWYLWTGELSSLFGKKEMTTFERYFIEDKHAHYEEKNAYYSLRDNEGICKKILMNFGLYSDDAHIINGHTPIKEMLGESPIKGNGKLIVIDGGFSKPYQKSTGISGYTLISNSVTMQLVVHSITNNKQPYRYLDKRLVDKFNMRKLTLETDLGIDLIEELYLIHQQLKHHSNL